MSFFAWTTSSTFDFCQTKTEGKKTKTAKTKKAKENGPKYAQKSSKTTLGVKIDTDNTNRTEPSIYNNGAVLRGPGAAMANGGYN